MNDSRISKSRPSISPYAIEYRIDPDSPFPIEAMVRASGMSLADVARRMGYINVNKGLRRLFDLMQGDTQHGEHIAPQLAQALGLDQQAVDVAIEDWRFRPMRSQRSGACEARIPGDVKPRFRGM